MSISTELTEYISVPDWFAGGNGARVFPTRSSVDWFVKQHRGELIECGALITRRGRAASLVSTKELPKAIVRILRRQAVDKDNARNESEAA